MADLYFTYCNGCHETRDCLPHEDEFLCVGDGGLDEGVDCYTRITAAQDALRRERLARAEADIRASQDEQHTWKPLGDHYCREWPACWCGSTQDQPNPPKYCVIPENE